MKAVPTIDAAQFVSKLQPALAAQDWAGLVATVHRNWTPEQLVELLHHSSGDARKVAALALGLVGKTCCLPDLCRRLNEDDDRMVVEMAEHAMWGVWFRGGSDAANKQLALGAAALNRHDVPAALGHLDKAILLSPEFPEAYNQRAIALYTAERYHESIADCRVVVEWMPLHFGAWSGMGHGHLALGELPEALHAYERALAVNPHLECVAELVQELREQLGPG